jgi:acetyltransferase-like isoleucine patch superfamily enzyme
MRGWPDRTDRLEMLRRLLNPLLTLLGPRMRYGVRSGDGQWRAHSRIGSATAIEAPERLQLGDHVFIGHFNYIDASGGLAIDDGVQITNHVSVLTHSTHRTLRLEREAFWGHAAPAGVQRAATSIGAWAFIGPHCTIAPGARIGRAVLVRANSYVGGEVPDFAIVQGQPARVVGDVRDGDRAALAPMDAALRERYEAWVRGIEALDGHGGTR